MKNQKNINSNIDGVKIFFENIISDNRGTFFDLVENGFDNQTHQGGVSHIYATISKEKLVARGNHFHYENFENFYALAGTALWILLDCRENSETYGNVFSFISSYEKYMDPNLPVYSIQNNEFVHFTVPPKVYHLVAPLTDEPVMIVAFGSVPFKESDFGKPENELMKRISHLISQYNIKIQN